MLVFEGEVRHQRSHSLGQRWERFHKQDASVCLLCHTWPSVVYHKALCAPFITHAHTRARVRPTVPLCADLEVYRQALFSFKRARRGRRDAAGVIGHAHGALKESYREVAEQQDWKCRSPDVVSKTRVKAEKLGRWWWWGGVMEHKRQPFVSSVWTITVCHNLLWDLGPSGSCLQLPAAVSDLFLTLMDGRWKEPFVQGPFLCSGNMQMIFWYDYHHIPPSCRAQSQLILICI